MEKTKSFGENKGVNGEKIKEEQSTLLELCKKYGMPKAYDALSHYIAVNPQKLLKFVDEHKINEEKMPLEYSLNLHLYKNKEEEAKKAAEKILEIQKDQKLKDSLKDVVENFPKACELIREYWRINGIKTYPEADELKSKIR